MPADAPLSKWGPMIIECGEKSGRPFNTIEFMAESIKAAGFTNLQERDFKVPLGAWAKHPVLKESGRLYKQQALAGLEGYVLYLLTNYGSPKPWTAEEVQICAFVLATIRDYWGFTDVLK